MKTDKFIAALELEETLSIEQEQMIEALEYCESEWLDWIEYLEEKR